MEGWLSGRKHLTANEAVRNGTGVRISHLPLNITEAPARELRDEISIGTQKRHGEAAAHRWCGAQLTKRRTDTAFTPKQIHSRTRGNARCKRNRTSSTISD